MIQKHVSSLFFLCLISFSTSFLSSLHAQTSIKPSSTQALTIGERLEFHSEILQENRVVNVYLPLGYSRDSTKTYPVIYLLDGSIDEDFIHIAGLVQFGSFSWIHLIPQSIVVGIANVDRKRDFTYSTSNKQDQIDYPTTGKSDQFMLFLEKELQVLIQSNYATNTTKTLIGQSLGGLLATEILFKKPDLFTHYIIVSPSLWWDDESLLNYEPKSSLEKKSIFIAVGKEGEVMERTAKALHNKLIQLKKPTTHLHFEFFEDKNHGDALHLAVYSAFEKLFSNQN